jgi:large subunit ribosomal protein L6
MPIDVPQGVKVEIKEGLLTVTGPKGSLQQAFAKDVSFKQEGAQLVCERRGDTKQDKSFHGLYRKLASNMVKGVTQGFTKTLVINGVGFKADIKGKLIVMNLGFSNDVVVMIPDGITATVDQNTKITISGIDAQKVGQFAAEVRKLRLPEPYKGKGIRYDDEHIRRKVGKSGVK